VCYPKGHKCPNGLVSYSVWTPLYYVTLMFA
jgi:hypothetical protein